MTVPFRQRTDADPKVLFVASFRSDPVDLELERGCALNQKDIRVAKKG